MVMAMRGAPIPRTYTGPCCSVDVESQIIHQWPPGECGIRRGWPLGVLRGLCNSSSSTECQHRSHLLWAASLSSPPTPHHDWASTLHCAPSKHSPIMALTILRSLHNCTRVGLPTACRAALRQGGCLIPMVCPSPTI